MNVSMQVPGVFLQPNGSMIPCRGGIMTPIIGTRVCSVEDIENLPWTGDPLADAWLFRISDEFVREETTCWLDKKKAIFTIVCKMYGYMGTVSDDMVRATLRTDPFHGEHKSIARLWMLNLNCE